ncbi:hydrogenase maturation protease [Rhodococcoides kyotonense]|uniref:Hydrogenase maturation protease n=1 Tax=Rhodococcoides kyotonense TaxID=398843 RepID=A0A239JEY6_9NOCA|nr:hydrogenase maturation protease [Rhodococcus kyotonensis]SNT04481.1 hydrogenase maturation protease [Rhodococcus kyotonensis]
MHVLIAGIGNIFFGDDGFGPEVSRRIPLADLPTGVRNVDYGIRGLHLAYDLLENPDALVLVDAVPNRGEPGALRRFQVTESDLGNGDFDPHGMSPMTVLSLLDSIGAQLPPRTVVIGCQVDTVAEGIGLSAPVAAAVDDAVALVLEEVV